MEELKEKMEKLKKRVLSILTPNGYMIKRSDSDPDSDPDPRFLAKKPKSDFTIDFTMKEMKDTNTSESLGNLLIIIRQDEVNQKPLIRNTQPVLVPVFYVKTLFIKPEARNRNFATLLMIYGLSTLKTEYPGINYALLEDCSCKFDSLDKNIYHRLGFLTQYQTEMLEKKKIKINDTEKQLLLDNNFIGRANRILDHNATIKLAGGRLEETQKHKKTKNKNKTQKNKKQKQNTKKQKSS
jgi:hypothetical protein